MLYKITSTSSSHEIANVFTDYFCSEYPSGCCSNNIDNVSYNKINLSCFHISISQMYTMLSCLGITKGPGTKFISILLKQFCSILVRPLFSIFNETLATSNFPSFCKLGYVTQIYKTAKIYRISNYRPNMILNTIPKLFKILLTEFLTYDFANLIIPV